MSAARKAPALYTVTHDCGYDTVVGTLAECYAQAAAWTGMPLAEVKEHARTSRFRGVRFIGRAGRPGYLRDPQATRMCYITVGPPSFDRFARC